MRTRLANPRTAVALGAATILILVCGLPLAHLSGESIGLYLWNPLTLLFAPIGLLVAAKRPENPIGWTILLAGVFAEIDSVATQYALAIYRYHHGLPLGSLAVVLQPSWAPAIVLFGIAIQLFPTGHLPAGRWRWVLWAFVGIGVLWVSGALAIVVRAVVEHDVRLTPGGDLAEIDSPSTELGRVWSVVQDAFFTSFGVMLLAWLTREWPTLRSARGERRQQLKLLIGGAVVASIGGLVTVALSGRHGILGVVAGAGTLAIAALPVSVGIGVLKYRLYDIDRLISRTISYAVVTGSLVAVFLGLVLLTTRVLPFSSPVGVAAATLAAAALFNPLRRRVQQTVDRRFNRARYDADTIAEAFALRLRNAIDPESVQADLVATASAAVAPTHVALWVPR